MLDIALFDLESSSLFLKVDGGVAVLTVCHVSCKIANMSPISYSSDSAYSAVRDIAAEGNVNTKSVDEHLCSGKTRVLLRFSG